MKKYMGFLVMILLCVILSNLSFAMPATITITGVNPVSGTGMAPLIATVSYNVSGSYGALVSFSVDGTIINSGVTVPSGSNQWTTPSLSAGTHTLTISDPASIASISYVVLAQPIILLSATNLNVPAVSGIATVFVSNAGGGNLVWTATSNSSWITLPGGTSIHINYTANTGSARTGTVTVSAPGAANTPQTITINQAATYPGFGVFPSQIITNTFLSGSGTFEIHNYPIDNSGSTINWYISYGTGGGQWFTVSPMNGTIDPGNYTTASVNFDADPTHTHREGTFYVNNSNNGEYLSITVVDDVVTGISLVNQNYPNPFNPSTNIDYKLLNKSRVTIKVYNVLGDEVAMLADEIKGAGNYSVKFDGSHNASGIYFVRFLSIPLNGDKPIVKTMKMILMK
ncbi:MAG: BACON domain-containing carbohydrate-binding protein [Ignavibacteriaceae bacterium]|nr:BACON domain-containing carbohydrate-binding protein [Ignavibacteriaceae bacterium]